MEVPLKIAFHNTEPSAKIDAEIRKHVAKLEKIYDRLVSCRVSVELRQNQHRTGNVYEVHIEMTVPTDELVVTKEPHRVKQRYHNPTLETSLKAAFKAATKRLKEFKEQLRGEVKPQPVMYQGRVVKLFPHEDYGFIETNEGTQLYFHRNSVMNLGFDKLEPGLPVHFIETIGDNGPMASRVWTGSDIHAQRN